MKRLAGSLVGSGSSGQAEVAFRFRRDDAHKRVLEGRVRALLQLRCQRCLGAVEWPVDASVRLVLVEGLGEAAALPDAYDPLVIEDGAVRLRDVAEDELILALPVVPRHEASRCRASASEVSARTVVTAGEPIREKPFAVLAEWKRRGDGR